MQVHSVAHIVVNACQRGQQVLPCRVCDPYKHSSPGTAATTPQLYCIEHAGAVTALHGQGPRGKGQKEPNLPLARSATASSCATSIAAAIAASSRLSCVGVSASCCAVARVAAVRCLRLRIGLQKQ